MKIQLGLRIALGVFASTLYISNIPSVCAADERPASTPIQRQKIIYFGNSLTGCTKPDFHAALGKSAGKEWIVEALLGPGWGIWTWRDSLLAGKIDEKRLEERGDLTIDKAIKNKMLSNAGTFKRFKNEVWDGMLLQFFHTPLKMMSMLALDGGRTKYDKLTDVGDIQASIDMIDMYLEVNPKGKVYIYQNWPNMEAGKVPPADQLPEWAKVPGARLQGAEFPLRDKFDYETEWLVKKYKAEHGNKFWLDNVRCQDIGYQLMEALKEHYPELWKSGRLVMIPVGDVFMALQRKMKAGKFPGVTNISDFYTDVQHSRMGMPRYTAAATFYALMFQENPNVLDWKIYNTKEAYFNPLYDKPIYDPYHDRGELLEMTAETAKIVNDTIWEVVTSHPYTQIKSNANKQ